MDKITLNRRELFKNVGTGIVATPLISMGVSAQTISEDTDESEWPTFGVDLKNSGTHSTALGPTNTVGVDWSVETNGPIVCQPAIVDEVVYVGSVDNNLYALDTDTGDEQWTFETSGEIRSSPTVLDDTVYVGNSDGNLYAVDATDGSEQWIFEADGAVDSSPQVSDGAVYIGLNDINTKSLQAVDASEGDELWSVSDFGTATTVGIADETVYVGTGTQDVRAYTADGDLEWSFETNDFVFCSPTIYNETVFFGSNDSNIYAVTSSNGDRQWAFETDGRVANSLAIGNGTVFASSWDGRLYAIDISSGEEEWNHEFGDGSEPRGISVVSGVSYITTNSGEIYALDTDSGDVLWSFDTEGQITKAPVVIDESVYVGTRQGSIYRLNESSAGSGGTGVLFRQASKATETPLALIGGGLVSAGLGYLSYKKIWSDNSSSQTQNGAMKTAEKEPNPPKQRDSDHSSVVVDEYDDIEIGEVVQSDDSVQISSAKTQNEDVWLITPISGNETVSINKLDSFLNDIDSWIKIDSHQNLLNVYGQGTNPLPWIAVEPANKPSLKDKTNELTIESIISHLAQACDAVHHVHRYGLSYGNLSVESLLVDEGTLKLRGIVDHVVPSSKYELPTREEDPTSEQADIYRLAATAYELLTGISPDREPDHPSDHNSSLPPVLDDVLLTALSRNPTDRQETILYLRDDLQVLSGNM